MKHLKIIFNALKGCILTVTMAQATAMSAAETVPASQMDSIEISLLTCQPHDEVYSLYGHTAIRFHDLRKGGVDVAFNYGVFDYRKPFFVARFVFGITDYELGAYPYDVFQREYKHFGSMVTEQVLNLTSEEKTRLWLALAENLLPDNCVYRYNYFYSNCTTKARDIIENCINGKIEYAGRQDYIHSYRDIVHDMTRHHPWTQFGIDLLLGIKADATTTRRQQEFLPNNLMYDFDHAQIHAMDGSYRPLVSERRIAVPAGVQVVKGEFPVTPLTAGLIVLAIGIVLAIAEYRQRRAFLAWDLLLMIATGTVGIVLFLMLFSQHPTVSLNLQLLLFNPLPWFFVCQVGRRKPTRYWRITIALSLLFLIGGMWQHYATGLWCLALCLLIQACLHTTKKFNYNQSIYKR